MTTDSVKFLNEKCLLSARIAACRELVEAEHLTEFDEHLLMQLGRMLGATIMECKAEVSMSRNPGTGDYIRQAEVYALSPMEMRKLYDMIQEEVRAERKGV